MPQNLRCQLLDQPSDTETIVSTKCGILSPSSVSRNHRKGPNGYRRLHIVCHHLGDTACCTLFRQGHSRNLTAFWLHVPEGRQRPASFGTMWHISGWNSGDAGRSKKLCWRGRGLGCDMRYAHTQRKF